MDLNSETADSSNSLRDLADPATKANTVNPSLVTTGQKTVLLTTETQSSHNISTTPDESFMSVLGDTNNKGIVVRSLIVLAVLTVLVAVFFIIKLLR